MNFVLVDPSCVCFAVVQFKKDTGLPVSMFMFLIWLSILTNAFNAFMFCEWGCLRISVLIFYASVKPGCLRSLFSIRFLMLSSICSFDVISFRWHNLELITIIRVLKQITFFVWTCCVFRHFVHLLWSAHLSKMVGFATVLTWLPH